MIKKNWPDLPYAIVLNTRSKNYHYAGLDIRTLQLYKPEDNPAWCGRLKKHLKAISSEYVLLLLDDFFCFSLVNQARIEQCLEWMDKDKDVSVFYLWKMCRDKDEGETDKYPGFYRRKQECDIKTWHAPAIWRSSVLLSLLRNNETLVDFETRMSMRAERHFTGFYALRGDEKPIYPSEEKEFRDGYIHNAIHHGKWSPLAPQIFERYGVSFDFSERGFYELDPPWKPYSVVRNFPRGMATAKWWREFGKRIHYYSGIIS